MAKILLRGVNCCCSLVVLALIASTFAIFNATKALPPRNNLPPWAISTPQWPQITVLVIACVSLVISLYIMYSYWQGGHDRAEKAAVYWTVFAVGTFIFTIVVWAIAAGIMQGSRNSSQGKDLWGWACKDNTRRKLFQDDVNYRLVCRQQVKYSLTSSPLPEDTNKKPGLGPRLRHHRDRGRNHLDRHLRVRLLETNL